MNIHLKVFYYLSTLYMSFLFNESDSPCNIQQVQHYDNKLKKCNYAVFEWSQITDLQRVCLTAVLQTDVCSFEPATESIKELFLSQSKTLDDEKKECHEM